MLCKKGKAEERVRKAEQRWNFRLEKLKWISLEKRHQSEGFVDKRNQAKDSDEERPFQARKKQELSPPPTPGMTRCCTYWREG